MYEEGENISRIDVLEAAAKQLGLVTTDSFLSSDQGEQEIKHRDLEAKHGYNISGVHLLR